MTMTNVDGKDNGCKQFTVSCWLVDWLVGQRLKGTFSTNIVPWAYEIYCV